MSTVEQRLSDAGHQLPHAPSAVANYVPAIRTGNLAITSGQLPTVGKELMFKGKLGREIHEEDGHHAARLCALNALSSSKSLLEIWTTSPVLSVWRAMSNRPTGSRNNLR